MSIHEVVSSCGRAPARPRPVARPFTPPQRLDHTLAGMQEWPLRSYLELEAVPASVRIARSHARNTVGQWQLAELADTAELLVSEITTNAVRASAGIERQRLAGGHGECPLMRLWLTSDWHNVLIRVWDGVHRLPAGQDPRPDAESGRGMLLIESLSTQCGCCERAGQDGKIIWAVCSHEAGATGE
jgi:hypothetical protein